MLRRLMIMLVCTGPMLGAGFLSPSFDVTAQEKAAAKPKPTPTPKSDTPLGQITAEQVVELAIYLNGGREGMAQVRRSGSERGRITRVGSEGKSEEATYERRFIRGESVDKDRVRFDQKMPTADYALIFVAGQVWGIINDATFTPRQETTQDFLMRQYHGIETLLRYKENVSIISYAGKEKQKGVEMHIVDLTDKENRRTRFYISAKTARVLWLEYETPAESGSKSAKYTRKFHDYRLAQGTLVPYKTVLYRDGTQIEETQVMTVTYGQKIDEALFRNPDSPAATTASKP